MQSTQEAVTIAIRVRLAAINESQAWLAKQLGESSFWLSRRMNDQPFTLDDIDRIAEVFGTDIVGLLETAKAVAS